MRLATGLLTSLLALTVSCKERPDRIEFKTKAPESPTPPAVVTAPVTEAPTLPASGLVTDRSTTPPAATQPAQNPVQSPVQSTPGKGGTTPPVTQPPVKQPPVTQPPVTKPDPECDTVTLDFEKKADNSTFLTGERVKNQYSNLGISIASHKRLSNGQYDSYVDPIIFDSSENPNQNYLNIWKHIDCTYGNCEGFDADLKSEKNHNVLVIAEHMYDINPTDDLKYVSYPDDNAHGGVIKLFFSKPAKVISMDLLDISTAGNNVELYSKTSATNYERKSVQAVANKGEGSLQNVVLDNKNFTDKLMINFSGEGAVDNIKLCIKK